MKVGTLLSRYLHHGRTAVEQELAGTELWWCITPDLYLQRRMLTPLLTRHLRGRVLDVGCGTMPFRRYLEESCVDTYEGLDVERRSAETIHLEDAQRMPSIPSVSYDGVVSLYALEHMPKPWLALAEIVRVCRPGGTIVLALPHLSRLHEEPQDYWRFTPHGLRALGEAEGLEIVEINTVGGLWSFLGHQISTLMICSSWAFPVLRWIVFGVNYVFVVRLAVVVDQLTSTRLKFPANVIAVFRRPCRDGTDPASATIARGL